MKLLLDTHLLLWTAAVSERVGADARTLIDDPANTVCFSVIAIWETAIKYGLRRKDFGFEPRTFRRNLLRAGFDEIEIRSEHALAVSSLPALHRDPFDRLLIAQAAVEGMTLVTSDRLIAQYGGSIRLV